MLNLFCGSTGGRRTFIKAASSYVVMLVVVGTASIAHGEKSIFDDDWTPPKRDSRPTPTTPKATEKPPAVTPPVGPPEAKSPETKPPVRKPAESQPAVPAIVRRPIPAKSELVRSNRLLKEAFAAQLSKTSPKAREELARVLIDEAAKAGSSSSDQFAMYGGAVHAAKEAMNLRLLRAATEAMGARFEVDFAKTTVEAALSMQLRGDTPAKSTDNVLAGLELAESLAFDQDYINATKVLSALRLPAGAMTDKRVAAYAQRRLTEIEALRAARDRAAPFITKLAATPNDAVANVVVGAYHCFSRGDWDAGLPMLARGNDAELKRLALLELAPRPPQPANPTDADALVAIADGWWAIAERQPVPSQQLAIRRHIADFYQQASAAASPLLRITIDKRMADLERVNPDDSLLSELLLQQYIVRLSEFRDSALARVTGTRTPITAPDGVIEGDVTWTASPGGHTIAKTVMIGFNRPNHGKSRPEVAGKVIVEPGFVLEGGTITTSKGVLDLRGEPGKPIVLKNVTLLTELTGTVRASNVIFDNCTFGKTGAFFFARYSSKWEFSDCLLMQSNFRGLKQVDYGFKIARCTFVECKLAGREKTPGKDEDTFKNAQSPWSRLAGCDFFRCEIEAPVCWLTRESNYYECKVTEKATYKSPTNLPVALGLIGADRQTIVGELRTRTIAADEGQVLFTASTPFSNGAFPKP